VPFGFFERARLSRRLTEGPPARLIVLLAPAGFGKTALLASVARDWAKSERGGGAPMAWYSLDSSDDDAALFAEGLVQAVRGVVPGAGKDTLAVLRGVPDPRAELPRLVAVLSREIRQAAGSGVYIVLDDFHRLTDKTILQCVENIAKDAGSAFRLVISTESEVPFYLSTLRAQRALVEVDRDELLFTRDEVEGLLRSRSKASIDGPLVESVARETRGWPSATAVAAAIVVPSGRPLPFTRLAPTEHGYSQLVRHLLASLPGGVKDGMLRSSLLPILEPDALSVAGVTSPEALLSTVAQLALPAAPTADGEGLRYDPVLRAALERELAAATSAPEMRALQKSIALHYATRGQLDLAFSEYSSGWAHEEAAAFVEVAADEELARGHVDTVLRWLRSMPGVTRRGRPRLMVLEARALLARGDYAGARVLLATAEADLASAQDWGGLGARTLSWGRLLFREGRHHEASKAAGEALSRLEEGWYSERADAFDLRARADEMLGNLPDAFDAAAQGLAMAERSGSQELVVRALTHLAALAELRGDLSNALSLSGRAVQRASLLGTEDLAVLESGFIAGSVHLEHEHLSEAERVGELMASAAERLRDPGAEARARLLIAGSSGVRSAGPRNDRAEKTSPDSQGVSLAPADRLLALESGARVLLAQGKTKEGLSLAREALGIATSINHRPSVLRCELLVGAASAAGESLRGTLRLVGIRGLRDALYRTDSRRWLAAAQSLVALGYVRLGIRWRARRNLEKSFDLALGGGFFPVPRLPIRMDAALSFAVRNDVRPELAGTLLRVNPARGEKLLAPLLAHKNSEYRSRASRALEGMKRGSAIAPLPRVSWPDLACDAVVPPTSMEALGGLGVIVDNSRLQWPSADARNVAAYLLVNKGRCVPREAFLSDVWPDLGEAEALVRLNVALYRLREGLGTGFPRADIRAETRGEYCWSGEGLETDADRFRHLVKELDGLLQPGESAALAGDALGLMEEAIAVYGGEFLDGIDFPWCHDQREELRANLLAICRLLMNHYMAGRRWDQAIRCGLKSLRSDPLQEDVVRDLMLCYFKSGDRASVVRQYREVKRLLARERGEWPSEETRQLRVRLLGK
ncbi:MAG TPA: BTAD domain-containing putative transcriptional regulator, partial [Chloroflexota bacterium]